MLDTIFREYDIRGKVNGEFNLDKVYDLIRSIAFYFVQENPAVKTVVLGMDGRTHSLAIKKEVCRGLTDSGLDVVFVGIVPSPVLYFALYTLEVDAGLMITASHNPKEYNGLKICLGKKSVWGVQVREIRDLFKARAFISTAHKGAVKERLIIDSYINVLADQFPHLIGMDLSVVIDCGNGAAGAVMPQLVKRMNWKKVRLLYPEVDGTYPNHEADPVKEKNMADVKHLLQTTDVQLGIGLDGDADRMAPMTKSGFLVPGDQLLAIFSKQLLKNVPGATVVMDIKSSSGLIELLQKWGGKPHLSPSGHAIIKDQMRIQGALLGGELSCHFFFADRYYGYDDGIYAVMRLLEIIVQSGVTLAKLLEEFPTRYSSIEYRIACSLDKKQKIVQHVKEHFSKQSDVAMITIDGVRVTFDNGWAVVRPSNTQPLLSMRFEANTLQGLCQIKEKFAVLLAPFFDETELRREIGLQG